MAHQIDWDKKYQEDLERAQALSLESLALEKFRQNKLLQERSKVTTKVPKNDPGTIICHLYEILMENTLNFS